VSTDPLELWRFLPLGYLLTIAMETPILMVGLSARHPLSRRILAGVWLTACTYPIVVIVLPQLVWRPLGDEAGYWPYVAVAEVFAPAAECLLFWLAFGGPGTSSPNIPVNWREHVRDFAAIIVANLFSFVAGWWLFRWWG
jgi:hypothetical protein